MPPANTIDEVIDALTGVIDQARADGSRLGYFPALYRQVTRQVKKGIAEGRFADGARMERLDVIFANRYLQALEDWRAARPASRCWQLAFTGAQRTDRAIIQHLLLGMNAHINLDLAVAAAEVAPGAAIHSLQGDFEQINRILSEQIDSVQTAIATVAPLMWLLDFAGGEDEERLVAFSLTKARDAAWMQALVLAAQDPAAKRATMQRIDDAITLIGSGVLNPPGFLLRNAVKFIVRTENGDVRQIIDVLA